MKNIIIQPYGVVNKDDVVDLILPFKKGEFGIPITLDMQPDLKEIPTFYQINKGNFWVARIHNKIVGTIALLDIGNNRGALRKMFVAKEYRGKEFGIGQDLLTYLMGWAKQNHIIEIFIGTIAKFIAAQRFYEKNGFIEVPKEELPKEFPVMDVDVKFYRITTL